MVENTTILRLDNISKSLVKVKHDEVTHVLNEVSLSMKNGEFISLMGLSGYGKSTMLHFMTGLTSLTTGYLTVNGIQTMEPSPKRGAVFQRPILFSWLTVEKSTSFSLKLQGKLRGSEEKVEKMFKIIGPELFRNDYPGQLSDSTAQRVPLMRSLINESDILPSDEPLGALGVFTCTSMQDEILKVWQEKKQSAVMAIHDTDEAIYMGIRVTVTDVCPGRVVSDIRIGRAYPRERSSQIFVTCRNEILNRLHFGGRNNG